MKTKILVVDDSGVMRKLLSEWINSVPDLEVVGAAADANEAREMIKSLSPDVITLDVQMPGINGLDFLDRLMRLRPMPVVMVSAFTAAGSETTLRALELGAVDFIGKPRMGDAASMQEYTQELAEKLRTAHHAQARRNRPVVRNAALPPPTSNIPKRNNTKQIYTGGRIIFLGASTGGTEAIKIFLQGLPADCPPVLIVQHMPEMFTASFAKRLDSSAALSVIEAQGNETICHGTAYIAPGHSHLLIRKSTSGYVTELQKTPPVNRHRPSVDVLFDSAVLIGQRQSIGVILTGMGKDGAQGLKALHATGVHTFAQDEESCVVFGMPREAIAIGAVDEITPLDQMAARVMACVRKA